MSALVEESPTAPAAPEVTGNVKLISKDGEEFVVSKNIASLSELISDSIMADNNADDEEDDDEHVPEIQLSLVSGGMLSKVVEYLNHYNEDPMKEIPKPFKARTLKAVVGEWYNNFLVSLEGEEGPTKYEKLFELILAANFMNIKPLMSLACCAVAMQMKGKTSPKQIAEHFGINREYKEPDPEKLKEKYPWIKESPSLVSNMKKKNDADEKAPVPTSTSA